MKRAGSIVVVVLWQSGCANPPEALPEPVIPSLEQAVARGARAPARGALYRAALEFLLAKSLEEPRVRPNWILFEAPGNPSETPSPPIVGAIRPADLDQLVRPDGLQDYVGAEPPHDSDERTLSVVFLPTARWWDTPDQYELPVLAIFPTADDMGHEHYNVQLAARLSTQGWVILGEVGARTP